MSHFILSAFADEAGKEILTQIDAVKANGITHIEPRGLDYGNISDYSAEQCRELRKILDGNGIGISAIGSPFGKIMITDEFEPHFEKFKRCVENACILGTERIRIFSFYFKENDSFTDLRDEVLERLDKMCTYSLESGIMCCHENEKDIYGDTDDRCLDILKSLEGKIKGIFDPANFIQCGVDILSAYSKLGDYIDYLHIKDCLYENGKVVPAGKGDGKIPELLQRFAKKSGKHFLTLEPHLKVFDGLKDLEQEGGSAYTLKDDYTYPSNRAAFDAAAAALNRLLEQLELN